MTIKKIRSADCTDLRNMERFVEQHADSLRFVGAWKKWMAWDGTRWVVDATGAAERAAADTVRRLVVEASAEHNAGLQALDRAAGEDDLVDVAKRRIAAAKPALDWAIESHSASHLRNIVQLARSAPELAVDYTLLDASAWLLNVRNGTIDLRTGKLRDHRRDDLLTRLAPVVFDAQAACPTWDAFLRTSMAGDDELVTFLQRMVGYALTGDTREHVLAFLFGGGANGKSTFLSTIHTMLGDYATPAPRGLLFRARGERHPTEFASLFGARFVTCSEIAEGQAFDEALTKDLTGGDPIECRRMREDFWKFQPTHKLWIAGNHKPLVHGEDEGIWRRMRLVPFTVTIPEAERDKLLAEKLRAELSGILAWAVRGCLAWQRDGLGAPARVRAATDEYRKESDALGEFLERYCTFEREATVARKRLRESYETWAKENGHNPLGARRFSARLRERGVTDRNIREGLRTLDGWRGVRLLTDEERIMRLVTPVCGDVGTCREQVPVDIDTRGGAGAINLDPVHTSPNVPTEETDEEARAETDDDDPGKTDAPFHAWLNERGVA